MRPLENPSTIRIVTGHILSILGALGLAVSSFHAFDTVVFFWPSDRARLLRAAIMFVVSAILVASGALLFHDNHWWRSFMKALPLYVLGMGCLGILNHVLQLYLHRQPSFVTAYETTWFFVAIAGFMLAIFRWRPRTKHRKDAA